MGQGFSFIARQKRMSIGADDDYLGLLFFHRPLQQPLDVLAQEYEREAPAAYPPRHPCPYPELPRIDDGVWEESLTFWNEVDQGPGTTFAAGVEHELQLAAGTYRMAMSSGNEGEGEETMRLRSRRLGR